MLNLKRFFSRSTVTSKARVGPCFVVPLFFSRCSMLDAPCLFSCLCLALPCLASKFISSLSSLQHPTSKRTNDNGISIHNVQSSPVQSSPRKLYLYLPHLRRFSYSPHRLLFYSYSLLSFPFQFNLPFLNLNLAINDHRSPKKNLVLLGTIELIGIGDGCLSVTATGFKFRLFSCCAIGCCCAIGWWSRMRMFLYCFVLVYSDML